MSKMSAINLEIQEELEPLGYSSVQEAIADGWDPAEWFVERDRLTSEKEAHDWLIKERDGLIEEMENLTVCHEGDAATIYKAIGFIKENVK